MSLVLDGLSWVLLSGGAIFCIISGIGLNRMPDFYARIHAAGIADTLGAAMILLGLLLQCDPPHLFSGHPDLVGIKLMMVLGFLWITSPTSTHALAQSAYAHGLEPVLAKTTPIDPEARRLPKGHVHTEAADHYHEEDTTDPGTDS
jgi:multicomponent Na+:H+ antiporter subunit G